jgi:hypothetical protein
VNKVGCLSSMNTIAIQVTGPSSTGRSPDGLIVLTQLSVALRSELDALSLRLHAAEQQPPSCDLLQQRCPVLGAALVSGLTSPRSAFVSDSNLERRKSISASYARPRLVRQ